MATSLDQLRAVDLEATDIPTLLEMLTPVFRGLALDAVVIPIGTRLFRGRIVTERPANIFEVGPPPAELIRSRGRLNDVGERIGYFSHSRRPAYFEVAPEIGDFFILSRWVLSEPVIPLHVGYTADASQSLNSAREVSTVPWYEKVNSRDCRTKEIYQFLSSEITKRIPKGSENAYKMTIAIGKKFFLDGPHDGLLYPTIAMNGNADNIVILPKSFGKIRLVAIEFNKVSKREGLIYTADYVDSSVQWNSNGDIMWNGRGLKWELTPDCFPTTSRIVDEEWLLFRPDGTEIPFS